MHFAQISSLYLRRESQEIMRQPVVNVSMTIGDLINVGLLVLTIVGLIFTIVQLAQTRKINRASLVKELYFKLYDDVEMREIFYKIEWSEYFVEDTLDLGGGDEERKTDKLLSFFEIVCSMHNRGILTAKDMGIFHYEMLRVYDHPAIKNYFLFLENWQDSQGVGRSYVNYKQYCSVLNKNSKRTIPITF